MSEMLGNHYFLARKYCDASQELEQALLLDPANRLIKKKLIVCFIQTAQIQKAFDLFYSMIHSDLDFLLENDILRDDCPCPEIIYEFENHVDETKVPNYNLILAMLWTYCDIKESIKYFTVAQNEYSDKTKISNVLNKLNEKTLITK